MKHTSFSELLRATRHERKVGLRAFCKFIEYDLANYCRIENGIMPPPEELMPKLIFHLAIIGDDRQVFLDLAYLARGRIPADILRSKERRKLLLEFFLSLRTTYQP